MLKFYEKVNISMFMSKVLRHEPHIIGITLDENGWTNLDEFNVKLKKVFNNISIDKIKYIVDTDEKKRYSILDNKIRANQGHNSKLKVNLEFNKVVPNKSLYHGTIDKFINSIKENGLLPQSRQYVHLSSSLKVAKNVAKRRINEGNIVIIEIDVEKMIKDGYDFYLSDNNVFLVKNIPNIYFKSISYL